MFLEYVFRIVWKNDTGRGINGVQRKRRAVEALTDCAVTVMRPDRWTVKSNGGRFAETGGSENALDVYTCHGGDCENCIMSVDLEIRGWGKTSKIDRAAPLRGATLALKTDFF